MNSKRHTFYIYNLSPLHSNDDNCWWILALIKAYKYYGNAAYLTAAESLWKTIASTSVTTTADEGTTPNKGGVARTIKIGAGCDVNGAVYWARRGDSFLNAISTGLFAQTGALLYEITKQQAYLDGAKNAMGWLTRNLLDAKSGIVVVDRIAPDTCQKIPGALTYNTGVYIGANIVLARITGDVSYMNAAVLSANSASTTAYSGADLLMTEEKGSTDSGDSTAWRGMFAMYSIRLVSDPIFRYLVP